MAPKRALAHDGLFWRKAARFGARYGPEWWVKYAPPLFGVGAALAIPQARNNVRANLRRIRGPASPLRDAVETAEVFSNYAMCLAEVLSNGASHSRRPESVRVGEEYLHAASEENKGVVVVTIHSGGWETAGTLFMDHRGLDMMLVMEAERDAAAQEIHDDARRWSGLKVVRIGGDDPLAALPMLRHLKTGGILALQLDRLPDGMKRRNVRLLGGESALPEGPFRLAAMTGAPLLPVFCARIGYRKYLIESHPPLHLSRHAGDDEMNRVAQAVADAMTSFLRVYPTQWFHFGKIP